MIDLPVATLQPYPSKFPWYDVSQYLTPGRSLADGSVEDLSFQYSYTRKVA